MISYRDMTFCKETTCLNFGEGKCPRSLTENVYKAAIKWWGSDEAPICYYLNTPACYEPKDTD